MPTSDAPPSTRLIPTRRPMAHSAEPGRPDMIRKAIRMSISPATSSQDQPAEEDGDGEARQRRHDHRSKSENREHDAFEQEGFPVRLDRGAHRGLHFLDVFAKILRNGHLESPDACRAELMRSIACMKL